MRAISIKSVAVLEEELQLKVHHLFGMEQYTDYVFKPGGGKIYTATIVMEMSDHVISKVTEATSLFPDLSVLENVRIALQSRENEGSIFSVYVSSSKGVFTG